MCHKNYCNIVHIVHTINSYENVATLISVTFYNHAPAIMIDFPPSHGPQGILYIKVRGGIVDVF